MEREAAAVLGAIVEQRTVPDLGCEARTVIAHYLALQKVRTNQVRRQHLAMAHHLRARILADGGDPKSVRGFGDPTDEDVRTGSILAMGMAHQLVPDLLAKVWVLTVAPARRSFYVSDTPLVLHNSMQMEGRSTLGLACRGVEVHFPLSQGVELWMLCRSLIDQSREAVERGQAQELVALRPVVELLEAIDSGTALQLAPQEVAHANWLQVRSSARWVYSADGDFALVAEILEAFPHLREPLGIAFG